MTDAELLTKVKAALLIGGNQYDEMVKIYMAEFTDFLRSAGVAETILQSEKIVGIVSRGVSDLWNYGAGTGSLSPYFMQRATQLAAETGAE